MPEAPEFAVETPLGKAYADDPERASHLVDLWMRLADQIEGILPGSKEGEMLDVWLMHADDIPDPFDIGHPMGGITYSVNGDAWLIQVPDTHKLEWILAHELTHAVLGREWNSLGGTLEEGLCEYVAAQFAPELLPMRRLQVHMGAAALFGHDQAGIFFSQSRRDGEGNIEVRWVGEKGRTPDELWTMEDLRFYLEQSSIAPFAEERAGLQRVGTFLVFRIVDRHGLQGLHRLCRRANEQGREVVPFNWVMEAAGFNMGPQATRPLDDQFVRALIEPLQRESLHKIVQQSGYELGRYIASEYADHFSGFSGENFVKFSHGTLRSAEGARLSIFDLSEALRDATRAYWPVREQTDEIVEIPRAFRRW
jgi:hypothetical protein